MGSPLMSRRVLRLPPRTLPLYLYHFPALSGVPFHPALVARLRRVLGQRLAGLKDSSGDMAYARGLAVDIGALDVFPSTEAALIEARNGIFAGCISASANVNAALCSDAYLNANHEALRKAVAIRNRLTEEPLIAAVKATLSAILGYESLSRLLPPLTALEPQRAARLITELKLIAPL